MDKHVGAGGSREVPTPCRPRCRWPLLVWVLGRRNQTAVPGAVSRPCSPVGDGGRLGHSPPGLLLEAMKGATAALVPSPRWLWGQRSVSTPLRAQPRRECTVTAFLAVACPLLFVCQPFAAGSTVSTSVDWGCRAAALSRLCFLAPLNSAMLECTLPSLPVCASPTGVSLGSCSLPVEVLGPLAEACPAQLCWMLALLSCREQYCQSLCFQERARTAGRGLYAASNPFCSGWQGRGATWCTFLRPPGSRVWL